MLAFNSFYEKKRKLEKGNKTMRIKNTNLPVPLKVKELAKKTGTNVSKPSFVIK